MAQERITRLSTRLVGASWPHESCRSGLHSRELLRRTQGTNLAKRRSSLFGPFRDVPDTCDGAADLLGTAVAVARVPARVEDKIVNLCNGGLEPAASFGGLGLGKPFSPAILMELRDDALSVYKTSILDHPTPTQAPAGAPGLRQFLTSLTTLVSFSNQSRVKEYGLTTTGHKRPRQSSGQWLVTLVTPLAPVKTDSKAGDCPVSVRRDL
ncbi:Hypothetical protein AA314_05108 [Archangium gephyra]|uniref:Uncharacterized protein n=1 Tax=Archangium gephyra TaxID=48 RepID=A0AAC8TEZ6_9BACT|nr:Hypothetical protein AA314_05108 [Archangium gephyra]